MKTIKIMVVSLLIMLFVSCNKDEMINQQELIHKNKVSSLGNVSGAKLSTSGLYPVYEVKSEIMMHFQHFCQFNATGGVDGSAACGPTSYMMAAYCLAKYKDPNTLYRCNATKLTNIVQQTGVSTNILKLYNYALNYDNSFLTPSKLSTTNRETMKTFLKDALANDKFIITFITGYVYSPSTVNKKCFYTNTSSINSDMKPTGNTKIGTNPNYITGLNENGSTIGGHIIVLVRFVQTAADGSGYVEYIDPLANAYSPSNRRYVSFSRLLDSMMWNGDGNTTYDALTLGSN